MIAELLILSAFVMCLSHTISKERIFEPLRERLGGKGTWFGYLVSCPYCLSHWIAGAVVCLYDLRVVRMEHEGVGPRVFDWFVTTLVVVVVTAAMRILFYLIDEGQGLVRQENKMAKEEAKKINSRGGGG